jgi:hypothetical protein
MAKADITIAWLPLRMAAGCVAIYRGCAEEDARLQIGRKGEAGRVRARGITSEGYPVSLLPDAWRRAIDWNAESLKLEITNAALCSQPSYEVTNVELSYGDLVAVNLLTTTALGRARWLAAEALAWIIIGVPLEWKEWPGLPELARHTEDAEIALGEAICENRVAAWGRPSRYGRMKRIPSDDFRPELVELRATPASVTRLPKIVVGVDGNLTISPRYRLSDYKGPSWSSIECDSTTVRQAFPKPLRVERWMLNEAEPGPAPPTELSRVEPVPPPKPKQPASERAAPRRGRRGPRPGTIDRFAEADRALFPDMTTLMKQKNISPTEAARSLSKKIEGRGGENSRIRRLAERYRKERKSKKQTATRRNS